MSLVEVSALRLPNMPGGIAHEAFKEDTGLLRQVGYGLEEKNIQGNDFQQIILAWNQSCMCAYHSMIRV